MPTAAYISRRVVLPAGMAPAAILVDTATGRILRIAEAESPGPTDSVVDAGTHAILPGFIDPHVHINQPGRTHWEGFPTATRAAAAAGITTLVDMPLNSLPETTTVEALQAKRASAAGQSHVDYRLWGGIAGSDPADPHPAADTTAHIAPLAAAGVPGFKAFLLYPGCDGLGLLDETHLRAALPLVAATGLPLLVHAELPGPLQLAAQRLAVRSPDWTRYATWLASRPDESELAAIRLLIELSRELADSGTPARIHIVHLSTALALPMLREARAEGLPITVETCPHYLHFAAEDIPDSATLHKCAPPIRSEANRRQLWQALAEGTIDLVASDHSPCPPEMKTPRFDTSWGGIASLSLGPSILWTGMTRHMSTNLGAPGLASETWDRTTSSPSPHSWTLQDLTRLMSTAPATLAGLTHRKGQLTPGHDADLVIFDPEASFTVTPAHLHFRHPVSPYLGHTLTGVIRQTILRGQTIYRHDDPDGTFPGDPIGKEVIA